MQKLELDQFYGFFPSHWISSATSLQCDQVFVQGGFKDRLGPVEWLAQNDYSYKPGDEALQFRGYSINFRTLAVSH